jgi:DNA-binding Lrp family transcriptional regulator
MKVNKKLIIYMVIKKGISKEIIILLFRNPFTKHTITSLTNKLNRSRVGVWKTVKSLEKDGILKLTPMELLMREVFIVNLNWNNSLVEKAIEIYLEDESNSIKEKSLNTDKLKGVVNFLISHDVENPETIESETNLISIVPHKKGFIKIRQNPEELNSDKKINTMNLTEAEFTQILFNKDVKYINALKKGKILSGNENFIRFIKNLHKRENY